MSTASVSALGVALLLLPLGSSSQDTNKATVAAEFKGGTITVEELERSAAGELINLAVQRQKILENQLELRIASTLVGLEAKARGLSEADLLQQEVYAKVTEPLVEEIDAYYQASRDMMKEPQEKAVPRIKQALSSQRRQKLYAEFVDRLKAKYEVKTLLEAVRIKVDTAESPVRGPATAGVTIVEFSDFECPYCATLSKTLAEIMKQYGASVRLVFRHFPLERIHQNAMRAAEASVCALDQGRFWEMHEELFKGGALTEEEISNRATAAGLKVQEFQACLTSGRSTVRVRADMAAAKALGVSSTPSFFINGRPMRGAVPPAQVRQVIDEELAHANRKR